MKWNITETKLNRIIAVSSIVIAFASFLVALLTFTIAWWKPLAEDEIIVSATDELYIDQRWGELDFDQFLSIRNIGDAAGVITKIDGMVISKDRRDFRKYVTGKFWYASCQDDYKPLLDTYLAPNGNFQGTVRLVSDPSRETQNVINKMETILINYFDTVNNSITDPRPTKVDVSTANKIDSVIKPKLKQFLPGEYQFILQIYKNNEAGPIETKCYTFTVNPENISQLEELTQELKLFSKPYRFSRQGIRVPLLIDNNVGRIQDLKRKLGEK